MVDRIRFTLPVMMMMITECIALFLYKNRIISSHNKKLLEIHYRIAAMKTNQVFLFVSVINKHQNIEKCIHSLFVFVLYRFG